MKYQACCYTSTEGKVVHCIVDYKGNIVAKGFADRKATLDTAATMNDEEG